MRTNPERFIHHGLLALVFFTPLIFLPQVSNLYTLPKECFVRIMVSFLLVAWAVKNLSSSQGAIRFSPLGLPILLYLLAMGFSLFNAINPYTGAYEVIRRATYMLIFFLVINQVKDEKDISNICGAAVAAGLIVSILGVFQYFTLFNPDWLYQVARPSATFGNKNMASQYVIMVIPLAIALFFESKNEKTRFLWAVAAIEMVAYVVYANSRGAWLGLSVGGLIILLIQAQRYKGTAAQRIKKICASVYLRLRYPSWRTLLLIFLLSIHIVLPHILPMPTKLEVKYSERMASALDLSSGSARARLAVWANTLDLIKDHPLGVGINNWKVVYPKYTRSRMIDKVSTSELHFIDAHNDYLQMVSEIGIVGFAFFLWILFLLLRTCWKSADLKYSPFFFWSILGFMVTSFFSFPSKMPATSLFFWLIAGLIMANRLRIDTPAAIRNPWPRPACQMAGRPGFLQRLSSMFFTSEVLQRQSSAPGKSRQCRLKSAIKIFIGFCIIWLAFSMLFSYFQLLSDYHLQRANILRSRGKTGDSLKEYTRSLELNPWSYWAYFGRGRAYYKIYNFRASAKDNLSALKLYPNDINAHGNLGLAYSEQGLFDLAEREYKEALNLYPEDRRACYRLKELEQKRSLHLKAKADYERSQSLSPDSAEACNYRGYLYFIAGSFDEAIDWYKKAIEKNDRYAEAHNNLANAYRRKGLIDRAVEEHEKAILVSPIFVQAYRDLGMAYEEKRLFKRAMKAYFRVLRLKPDDADIHLDLGGLYLTRLYDKDRAIFHLKKSLELNPNHPRAEQIRATIEILSE